MKLYKINTYEAYRADEKGIYWSDELTDDSIYYKYEMLAELEVEDLAEPYTIHTDEDGKPFAVTADNILCLNMETLKWEPMHFKEE